MVDWPVTSDGRVPAFHHVSGLIPVAGVAMVIKTGWFFLDFLVHGWVPFNDTDHTFPCKMEFTISASAQALCTVWAIMPGLPANTYTRIYSRK